MGRKRTGQKEIYHVQIKFPHTGWRLASQVYSKRTAEKEAKRWRELGVQARVVKVQRRTKGLTIISRSGRVIGWT
jgi:hypothetical protein